MRELTIQAEVGRRLRDAIGRTHAGHALRTNTDSRMIDEIIASGMFTSSDKNALSKMHTDTLRALHKKFGKTPPKDDEEIEDVKTTDDEEIAVMANMGRTGKALERQNERVQRNARMERMSQPRYFHITNGVTDDEAIGMVPPTYKRKGR